MVGGDYLVFALHLHFANRRGSHSLGAHYRFLAMAGRMVLGHAGGVAGGDGLFRRFGLGRRYRALDHGFLGNGDVALQSLVPSDDAYGVF